MLAVLASLFAPTSAQAAWPRYPDVNLPVATGTGLQVYPAILEDGTGGAFIAWHDNRGPNYDIYVQRVSAAGVPLWTANGFLVCSATGDQANSQMVSDGAGGVIVAWHDYRAGNWDVYVQRLNASGVPQWTANGVALCTVTGDQTDPNLVSDGQGGAIVAWHDTRAGAHVYARRVNAAGAPQWTANGVLVCGASGTRRFVRLASDGANGAIITWDDSRGGPDLYDVYAQRLNGSGVPQWLAHGTLINNDGNQASSEPAIVSDKMGGAFIAWTYQSPGPRYVRMQRVNAAGARHWVNDVDIAALIGAGSQHSVQLASDGAGGAIAAWRNNVAGTGKTYAQRISSDGARQWGTNGVSASSVTLNHEDPRIASDGGGGAILTWYTTTGGEQIQAQRVNSAGSVMWGGAGVVVSYGIGGRGWPRIATDGAGGAIISWHDTRSGNHDVYAQWVDRYGYVGDVGPVVTSVRDVLNDQGGKVKVSWNASPLDADPAYTIIDYRLWRSVPQSVALAATGPGAPRAMTHDPEIAAAEGALLLTTSAGTVYAWEYAASQPAAGLPAYSITAYTTSDSVPGSNPPTAFMVEARAGLSPADPHWFSAPDSGYSVDNLAPATPSALVGMFANGVTVLHWAANGEADLSSYRLYRGTSAGFTPSPANRIASPASTNYDDPSGVPYFYKLSAVDIHGNESGFALLTPSGTLDVLSDARPTALRLGAPHPNPAMSGARISLDLPRPASLSLAVFDAAGREVRVLFRGSRPAGSFDWGWDLRDSAGRGVADGVYFVRLECEGRTLTQRMIAMR